MLRAVGMTEDEERVYVFLLDHPASRVRDISAGVDVRPVDLRRVLTSLEEKGVVSKSAADPRAYLPARPDLALEVLISRQEEQLKRTRLSAAQLLERFRKGIESEGHGDFVEIISGRSAYSQRFLQMQRGANEELVSFNKPPYVTDPGDCQDAELDRLRAGVRQRGIYERGALEDRATFAAVSDYVRAGEEVRVSAELPVKLAIVDRSLGLIPLLINEDRLEGVLVHPSPLLDALIALFESVWLQSHPFRVAASAGEGESGTLAADDQTLLALLAAGVQDKAIARQLEISDSSLQRRLKKVFVALGANSRFQAGAEAARRDLI